MKKGKFVFIIAGVIIALTLFISNCKLSGPDFTLTISVEDGVTGEPKSGTYLYKEFTEVKFKYENETGKVFPELSINGNLQQNVEGTLVMYSNMDIVVKQKDMRGEWKIELYVDDVKNSDWITTFSGATINSGTFTDDRGKTGQWEVAETDITLTFNDWENYIFTGNMVNMEGTWKNGDKSGKWQAIRQ